MPVSVTKVGNKYRVSTPNGVKAKATTKPKAEAQRRLLNAVEHGWKPNKTKLVHHSPLMPQIDHQGAHGQKARVTR